MRWTPSLVAVLSLVAVACGGNPPPPASSTPADSSSSAPASTAAPAGSSASSNAPPVGGAAPGPTMESQRDPFMNGCMKKVNAPDYCSCGFDQFRDIFKDADLGQSLSESDPRFAALKERTQANCASKLPEEQVKSSFMDSCIGDDKRKAPYCKCAWPALRKTLAVADFVGDFQGPRIDDAKKAMVLTCKGKFPADVAKADFFTGCSKGDASRNPVCECLWKKVRAKFSVEEIVSGTADVKSTPGLDQCK